MQITRHASGTIVDYSHALYKAVAHIGKLPEEFTQADADGYLSYLLSRQPQPAVSQFKHFIYGLKSYLHAMGYPDLAGLALPRIRREKRLPRVLSVEQVQQLLRSCDLYTKALFSVIYDCGLRAFEACQLRWNDISFDRQQVFIRRGKGGKDRIVPISPKTLQVLKVYHKRFWGSDLIFKKDGGLVIPIDNRRTHSATAMPHTFWRPVRTFRPSSGGWVTSRCRPPSSTCTWQGWRGTSASIS